MIGRCEWCRRLRLVSWWIGPDLITRSCLHCAWDLYRRGELYAQAAQRTTWRQLRNMAFAGGLAYLATWLVTR